MTQGALDEESDRKHDTVHKYGPPSLCRHGHTIHFYCSLQVIHFNLLCKSCQIFVFTKLRSVSAIKPRVPQISFKINKGLLHFEGKLNYLQVQLQGFNLPIYTPGIPTFAQHQV